MGYQVSLKSPAERIAKIRASCDAPSTKTESFYEFRGQKTELKKVRIEIGLPIYRVENFRTYIDQREYLVREKQPENFFSSGQENETAQQVQHEILAKLAQQGRADSVVPIIDVLRKEKQRVSILISHSGVVINGNRRLAAMRELLAEDSAAFGEFTYVDCLVLPEDATVGEIVDIEAELQGKPETKLDYDWIGDCQLINRLLSLGRAIPDIAARLNRRPKEIANSLQALAEADAYLKDWVKAERQYGRVRDGEQFFKDLPTLLDGKDASLQEASRVIGWTLFDNKEKLDDRLYSFNVTFGKRANDVMDRMAGELGIPLVAQEQAQSPDSFDVELEEDAKLSYQPVLDVLKDPSKREEAVDTLISVCHGVIESEKGKRNAGAALKAIVAAHSKLAEVDVTRAGPETFDAILKQLDAIAHKTVDLKTKINRYISDRQSGTENAIH